MTLPFPVFRLPVPHSSHTHLSEGLFWGDCGIRIVGCVCVCVCVCVFNRTLLSTYCMPRTVQFLGSQRLRKIQSLSLGQFNSTPAFRSVLREGQTADWKPWVQPGLVTPRGWVKVLWSSKC